MISVDDITMGDVVGSFVEPDRIEKSLAGEKLLI